MSILSFLPHPQPSLLNKVMHTVAYSQLEMTEKTQV